MAGKTKNHEIARLTEAYEAKLRIKNGEIRHLQAALKAAEEEIRAQLAARFGKKSEKYIAPGQGSLPFIEVEELVDQPDEENIPITSHDRKPQKRTPLPTIIPRERVEHDLAEGDKVCATHGIQMERIGEDVSEKLEIEPEKVYVVEHVRPKYSCPCCEGNIKQHPMPPLPIPSSIASASMLAYIIVSKYVDHLPLYRMEQRFKRIFVEISRLKMARWVIKASELMTPLYNLLEERLLEGGIVCIDETPVQVLKEEGRSANSTSYMWVRCRDGTVGPPIVLYDYFPSRSGEVLSKLLTGYSGVLLSDGYRPYESFSQGRQIIHAGCHAHARRRFWQSNKVSSDRKGGLADQALKIYQRIYCAEADCKSMTPDARLQYRQEHLAPIFAELRSWVDMHINDVPKTLKLGEALHYIDSEWTKLIRVLEDGRIPLDNNFTEQRIRPFAIGRKNWMFADTPNGAHASAMIYSLVETAKANGIEPFAFFNRIMAELPKASTDEDYEKLLPLAIHNTNPL